MADLKHEIIWFYTTETTGSPSVVDFYYWGQYYYYLIWSKEFSCLVEQFNSGQAPRCVLLDYIMELECDSPSKVIQKKWQKLIEVIEWINKNSGQSDRC